MWNTHRLGMLDLFHHLVVFKLGQLREWTCGYTWTRVIVWNCITYFWEQMLSKDRCIFPPLMSTQVQECSLGMNIMGIIGRCTCDFSCLRFNSATIVSNIMLCLSIDFLLWYQSNIWLSLISLILRMSIWMDVVMAPGKRGGTLHVPMAEVSSVRTITWGQTRGLVQVDQHLGQHQQ